jgi:hypothetical protein
MIKRKRLMHSHELSVPGKNSGFWKGATGHLVPVFAGSHEKNRFCFTAALISHTLM